MTSPWRLRLAARALAAGGIIAYPTEAVFGLGCDPRDGAAVGRLLALKSRAAQKGLILIAARLAQLQPFILPLAGDRRSEILASWPGPVTWVLPARPDTPAWLTGGRPSLAVRVTAHPLAAALCQVWGGALVSTSANRGGRPPARTALQVRRRLGRSVDLILAGACGPARRPTQIRDGRSGVLLRP